MNNVALTIIGLMAIGLGSARAQSFYDISTVQNIYVYFSQTNWDYQMDTAKAGAEGYVIADSVRVNDETFYQVGVKYKGNSSYQANQVKNPLHIALDEVTNQNYQGYGDIKLSNVFADPSFVREVLGYEILRNYMHAPLSNYTNVYINGALMGLYSSSESINGDFCSDHFFSGNNTLVKGNPVGGAGPGSNAYPDLAYYGTTESSYNQRYEIKSNNNGWDELIHLCDTIKNYTASVEEILDVDRALWMLAFNDVFVNLDSYTGSFKQNYYLYRDNNGRFNPIVWDLNMCFGSFSSLGSSAGGPGGGLSTTQMEQMTVFPHATETTWPLIYYLMQNARYKKMYMAHVRTMASEMIGSGYIASRGQELQNIVATYVNADPNKFYTTAQFQSNLNSAVTSGGGPGGGSKPAVVGLMTNRLTYLSTESNYVLQGPSIASVSAENNAPNFGDEVWIVGTISNANYAYLGFRLSEERIFEKTQMFDDGAHHDGAANDGVYGASFYINSGLAQYYVYAENNDAGKFSPARAEYEFYSITAVQSPLQVGEVAINEFEASNYTGQSDADGQFDDWIELYNNTSNAVSLFGMYLSDDPTNPTKWAFPADAVIAANGYLTVWADENGGQVGIHTNFKLSAGGESVIFAKEDGTILDEVDFGVQPIDLTTARCPNGTGDFTANVTPTYNAENTCVVSVNENDFIVSEVYPNPASSLLNVDFLSGVNTQVLLYSEVGELVFSAHVPSSKLTIDVSALANGVYYLKALSDRHSKVFGVVVNH
jgi:spore coat protein CotH